MHACVSGMHARPVKCVSVHAENVGAALLPSQAEEGVWECLQVCGSACVWGVGMGRRAEDLTEQILGGAASSPALYSSCSASLVSWTPVSSKLPHSHH